MLSRFVIVLLPRSKCLNFIAAVTICSDFGEWDGQQIILFFEFYYEYTTANFKTLPEGDRTITAQNSRTDSGPAKEACPAGGPKDREGSFPCRDHGITLLLDPSLSWGEG